MITLDFNGSIELNEKSFYDVDLINGLIQLIQDQIYTKLKSIKLTELEIKQLEVEIEILNCKGVVPGGLVSSSMQSCKMQINAKKELIKELNLKKDGYERLISCLEAQNRRIKRIEERNNQFA